MREKKKNSGPFHPVLFTSPNYLDASVISCPSYIPALLCDKGPIMPRVASPSALLYILWGYKCLVSFISLGQRGSGEDLRAQQGM